ncbi:UPF0481 protein At3g47200-like [Pistacia vera]|uniref:UPF0481 protein At3g47200-like n=1 Tax=Pistacia vera TaxID=55513 RepID=UPI001262B959|nr:UPF0481 protein At3g47200-like [Pistacia vera]
MAMCSSSSGKFQWDRCKDWLIDIPGDFELDPDLCCIYRVPKHIRKVNEEAYTPQIVSIGPFHYGKEELEFTEKQKGRYVREFSRRTTDEKCEQVLAFVKYNEKRIRNSYAETCKLESHEYVKMILRDAIFIIELIRRNGNDASDSLLSIPAQKIALTLDLLLLENQLPYFLLENLYELITGSPSTSFSGLCFHFFVDHLFNSTPVAEETNFKHFTDLQRIALVEGHLEQTSQQLSGALVEGHLEQTSQQLHRLDDVDLPSAAKLRESGVKFKRVDEPRRSLLDIKFERDELEIPQLKVQDGTETILRNIMVLEQCHDDYETLVCDYVELLDSLIDTKSDLDLLIKEGIICNCMGDSTATVSLFNKLCTNILLYRVHYQGISNQLKVHYDSSWNHTSTKLKSVYFSDLWRGTATVAAALILLLTFIQTISSVMH